MELNLVGLNSSFLRFTCISQKLLPDLSKTTDENCFRARSFDTQAMNEGKFVMIMNFPLVLFCVLEGSGSRLLSRSDLVKASTKEEKRRRKEARRQELLEKQKLKSAKVCSCTQ